MSAVYCKHSPLNYPVEFCSSRFTWFRWSKNSVRGPLFWTTFK